jgi:two-component sensor histidine kinase
MGMGYLNQRINKFFSTVDLLFSAAILEWRSRQGFMILLSLLRIIVASAILFRFSHSDTIEFIPMVAGAVYLIISAGIFIKFLFTYHSKITNQYAYWGFIFFDLVTICTFYFLTNDAYSDMYLLLLLPLITTAHYLPRFSSVVMSALIIVSYYFTLSVISGQGILFTGDLLLIWVMRSAFLLSATWIYRVQGNFPRINETRVTSPSKARAQLESMLREFKISVPYDSISVQLLYRGRFQIIACDGFKNPKDIYKIEFPVDDLRYPNHRVIDKQSPEIVNPDDYPSFKEPQYFAKHIKTWLGIPLISPTNGECFGMISIDSSQTDAFKRKHTFRASWFAKRVSSFLMEAALSPAAMSMITRRENILNMLKDWSNLMPTNTSEWDDDLQASRDIVVSGSKIFNVEDCSIYFLRTKIDSRGKQEKVLHLIASSALPEYSFREYEGKVTGREGDGLTGYTVHRMRTLNYGASQIQRSPYRSTYSEHLSYLFSKRSRQVLIVPLVDSKGNATGAIKLENHLGGGSDRPFSPIEQNVFEVFAEMVSLMLENIHQRNFLNRITQSVHNLRAILHPAAIKPIEEIFDNQEHQTSGFYNVSGKTLHDVHGTINYSKIVLDEILAESAEHLILEQQGLIPAVQHYLSTLKNMLQFSEACECISLDSHNNIPDELPFQMRVAFYNIAREAVLNMVRHAGLDKRPGGHGSLTFSQIKDIFHMTIQDNGVGIPPEKQIKSSHHFGLHDMEFQFETIRHLTKGGCDMKIESQPDNGTRIHVWASLNSYRGK